MRPFAQKVAGMFYRNSPVFSELFAAGILYGIRHPAVYTYVASLFEGKVCSNKRPDFAGASITTVARANPEISRLRCGKRYARAVLRAHIR